MKKPKQPVFNVGEVVEVRKPYYEYYNQYKNTKLKGVVVATHTIKKADGIGTPGRIIVFVDFKDIGVRGHNGTGYTQDECNASWFKNLINTNTGLWIYEDHLKAAQPEPLKEVK